MFREQNSQKPSDITISDDIYPLCNYPFNELFTELPKKAFKSFIIKDP